MITSKSLRIISLVGLISLPHLASAMNAGQQWFNQQQNANGNANQGGVSDAFIKIATGLMEGAANATAKVVQTGIDAASVMAERSRQAAEKRRAELKIIIDTYPANNPLHINAVRELDEIARQQKEVADNLHKMQAGGAEIVLDSAKMGTQAVGEWVNSQIRQQEEKQNKIIKKK